MSFSISTPFEQLFSPSIWSLYRQLRANLWFVLLNLYAQYSKAVVINRNAWAHVACWTRACVRGLQLGRVSLTFVTVSSVITIARGFSPSPRRITMPINQEKLAKLAKSEQIRIGGKVRRSTFFKSSLALRHALCSFIGLCEEKEEGRS